MKMLYDNQGKLRYKASTRRRCAEELVVEINFRLGAYMRRIEVALASAFRWRFFKNILFDYIASHLTLNVTRTAPYTVIRRTGRSLGVYQQLGITFYNHLTRGQYPHTINGLNFLYKLFTIQ